MSIRVTFVQPYLPAYRAPVYRRLAAVPGIDFTLVHARSKYMANVPAEGFRAIEEPIRIFEARGHHLYWQPSNWQHATLDRCDVFCGMWDVHYAPMVVPAIRRAKSQGVGTMLWGQGYSRYESWLRRRPRAWMGSQADALVFYNDTGREIFLKDGFDAERMFVANNSLDTTAIDAAIAEWTSEPGRLDRFRREQKFEDSWPIALCVARLYPGREIERLIAAAAKLWQRGLRFHIVLVGSTQAEYLALLKSLIARDGLDACVRFIGPCYDERELAGFFLSARVFPFPSFAGLSLHHALAYGVPVLVTSELNANGPEIEALRPGENGMTYRDGDIDDLAAQLGRMLTDDALTAHLKANARRVIDERYNVGKMVEGFVAAIHYAHAAGKRRR